MGDGKDLKQTVKARVLAVRPSPPVFNGRLDQARYEPPAGGQRFVGARLQSVDFSGLRIADFRASGSVFEACDFRRAVLRGTFSLPPTSIYRGCAFDRADLRQCSPGLARFERCSFGNAKLDGWLSWHAEFVDCRFAGRLKNVVFAAGMGGDPRLDRPRSQPLEFSGNDFRDATLVEVSFSGGIDLSAQLLPEGPDLAWLDVRPETLDQAEAYAASLPPEQSEGPFGALATVRGIRKAYRGQSQAFLARGTQPNLDLYERLLAAIRVVH